MAGYSECQTEELIAICAIAADFCVESRAGDVFRSPIGIMKILPILNMSSGIISLDRRHNRPIRSSPDFAKQLASIAEALHFQCLRVYLPLHQKCITKNF